MGLILGGLGSDGVYGVPGPKEGTPPATAC